MMQKDKHERLRDRNIPFFRRRNYRKNANQQETQFLWKNTHKKQRSYLEEIHRLIKMTIWSVICNFQAPKLAFYVIYLRKYKQMYNNNTISFLNVQI